MKSMKGSRASQHRPQGFRLMLKDKYSSGPNSLSRSLHEINPPSQHQNIRQHVRNRMKTEQNSHSLAKSSQFSSRASTRKEWTSGAKLAESRKNSQKNIAKASATVSAIDSKSASRLLPVTNNRYDTLKQYQERIQELLEKRMELLAQNKGRDDKIQSMLDHALSQVRRLKENEDSPEDIGNQISGINRKIGVFERLLAESMAESDLMKQRLIGRLSKQPSPAKRHATQLCTLNPRDSPQIKHRQKTLVCCSVTQQAFKNPSKQAYSAQKHKLSFFNVDRHRQPIHRSTYHKDFPSFSVPQQKSIKPINNAFMGNTRSSSVMKTSYQGAFSHKKVDPMNIKDLDAVKDKITSIQVSFGEKSKETPRVIPQPVGTRNRKMPITSPQVAYSKRLLSQSRRQYGLVDRPLRSDVKNRRLDQMKWEYQRKVLKN